MKLESQIDTLESDVKSEVSPKERRRSHRVARGAVAAVIATGSALGLSACAEAAPEPLEKDYKVGQVMLEADLAQTRQNVRELCNTGEGSAQVRQDWADYGYEERSGMEWIDAFTYTADLRYDSDPEAIIHYGSYTYPTIESLAENCVEAAYLASQPAIEVALPETASKLLDEFRTVDESDSVIALDRIFQIVRDN